MRITFLYEKSKNNVTFEKYIIKLINKLDEILCSLPEVPIAFIACFFSKKKTQSIDFV